MRNFFFFLGFLYFCSLRTVIGLNTAYIHPSYNAMVGTPDLVVINPFAPVGGFASKRCVMQMQAKLASCANTKYHFPNLPKFIMSCLP